jgi:aminobenzoyl-glutamate utilization protein B
MQSQLERLGPPPFDAADRQYAAQIQATLSADDIASSFARIAMPVRKDTPLCDFIVPYGTKGAPMIGSTDVGDVSWVVPTVQARVATVAIGTPGIPGRSPRRASPGRPRRAWSMPPR